MQQPAEQRRGVALYFRQHVRVYVNPAPFLSHVTFHHTLVRAYAKAFGAKAKVQRAPGPCCPLPPAGGRLESEPVALEPPLAVPDFKEIRRSPRQRE